MNLSGNPFDYLVVFLGGVLLSFTPCVYPLIPISAGYIGVKAAGSKLKGFFLSLIYVTGVAITYSALGIFASLTGRFFGAVSSHPITHIIVGLIIVLFGVSMLDVFLLPLPNIIKASVSKNKGYVSCFLLGLSSGLVVSACVTPVLGAILAYLATKKNILYGATLLFVFAYGMGLVLILAGTFGSLLTSLPKSGRWMVYIKRVCAFILIGVGLYFIGTALMRLSR